MPTTVKQCSCKNTYQDEVYGHGNRLYNVGANRLKCTVCSKEVKTDTTKALKGKEK